MNLYIPAFLIAFVVTVFVLGVLYHIFRETTLFRSPIGGRHIGKGHALRIGGIAMASGFFIALISDVNLILDTKTLYMMGGIGIFVIIGIYDDLSNLHWKYQMGMQICISVILFLMGIRIQSLTLSIGTINFDTGLMLVCGLIITILWIIIIINALNWSDGIDGLAGGITMIASATLFILALRPEINQPPVAIITAALGGTVLAFTCINLYTGKIIAGSSGTYFMGSVLAILAIFAGAKIGTALLVLIVPLIDALWVIIARKKAGKSIFQADTRHLHHRLIEQGWRKWHVLLVYYGLTVIGALCALGTQSVGKVVTFVFYGVIIILLMMTFTVMTRQSNAL